MKTWKVEIGFAQLVGVSEVYEVEAETKEEAVKEALELAKQDLEAIDVYVEE